jgi:L-ribulose-5-phosphate 3-epimerase
MVSGNGYRSPFTGVAAPAPRRLAEIPLGLYEKALPPELDWPERLAATRELGFSFLEMSIDETDERLARLAWSRGEREAVRREAVAAEVAIPSICLSGHRRFAFGSRDGATRSRAREILIDAIDFAADIGVRVIQLAGYDVYYEDGDAETVALMVETLREGLRHAARRQVMLAIEIMDTPFLGSIVRYLNLKRLLPSPWLAVYPDVGNLTAWGNDVGEELALGIDHIVGIHLKETHAATDTHPGTFREVEFGTGCVDFPAIFRRLASLEYDGPFLLEMWAAGKPEGEARTAITSAREWIIEQMVRGGYAVV